jgi:hypothetical protein
MGVAKVIVERVAVTKGITMVILEIAIAGIKGLVIENLG